MKKFIPAISFSILLVIGVIVGIVIGYNFREDELTPFKTKDGKISGKYLIYDLNKVSYNTFRHSIYDFEFKYPRIGLVRTSPDDFFDGNIFDEKNIHIEINGIDVVFSITLIEDVLKEESLEDTVNKVYNQFAKDTNPYFYDRETSKIVSNEAGTRYSFHQKFDTVYPPGGEKAMISHSSTYVIVENLKGQRFLIEYPTGNYLSEVILSSLSFF